MTTEPQTAAPLSALCSSIWNGCKCGRGPHADDRHVWMNTLDAGRAVDPAQYPSRSGLDAGLLKTAIANHQMRTRAVSLNEPCVPQCARDIAAEYAALSSGEAAPTTCPSCGHLRIVHLTAGCRHEDCWDDYAGESKCGEEWSGEAAPVDGLRVENARLRHWLNDPDAYLTARLTHEREHEEAETCSVECSYFDPAWPLPAPGRAGRHGALGNEGYCRCGYFGGGREHRDLAEHLAAREEADDEPPYDDTDLDQGLPG